MAAVVFRGYVALNSWCLVSFLVFMWETLAGIVNIKAGRRSYGVGDSWEFAGKFKLPFSVPFLCLGPVE